MERKSKFLLGIIIVLAISSVGSALAIDGENSQFVQRLLANAPVLCDDPELLCISNINGKVNSVYGEMWNYTSAGWNFDIDMNNVYYNLTNLTIGELNGFSFEDNTQENGGSNLITQVDGLYIMSMSLSFSSENVGGLYGISIAHDFDPDTHRNCYARRNAATTTGNVGITCIMDLHVGDKVVIMVENENTNRDMTIYTVNLNIVRIGNV